MTLLAPRLSWCDGSDGCLQRLQKNYGAENVKLVDVSRPTDGTANPSS